MLELFTVAFKLVFCFQPAREADTVRGLIGPALFRVQLMS